MQCIVHTQLTEPFCSGKHGVNEHLRLQKRDSIFKGFCKHVYQRSLEI